MEVYEGYLDWAFNDVYQIPAPYLKIWKQSTGEIVHGEVLQAWIDRWRQLREEEASDQGSSVVDHRFYRLGTLILETHPVLFRESFYSLHLCEEVSALQVIVDDVGQSALRPSDVLLLCVARLGPYVGLSLGPSQYQLLTRMMTETENI